jgi:hypothetical protein
MVYFLIRLAAPGTGGLVFAKYTKPDATMAVTAAIAIAIAITIAFTTFTFVFKSALEIILIRLIITVAVAVTLGLNLSLKVIRTAPHSVTLAKAWTKTYLTMQAHGRICHH